MKEGKIATCNDLRLNCVGQVPGSEYLYKSRSCWVLLVCSCCKEGHSVNWHQSHFHTSDADFYDEVRGKFSIWCLFHADHACATVERHHYSNVSHISLSLLIHTAVKFLSLAKSILLAVFRVSSADCLLINSSTKSLRHRGFSILLLWLCTKALGLKTNSVVRG